MWCVQQVCVCVCILNFPQHFMASIAFSEVWMSRKLQLGVIVHLFVVCFVLLLCFNSILFKLKTQVVSISIKWRNSKLSLQSMNICTHSVFDLTEHIEHKSNNLFLSSLVFTLENLINQKGFVIIVPFSQISTFVYEYMCLEQKTLPRKCNNYTIY